MKFKLNFDDTAQNRLIIAGLLVSTVLIIAVSIFAIGKIQEKLYESYANFGQLLGKTIAIQSYELTKNKPQNEKIKILKSHSVSILESNSDISFITFKDDKGNIIFSTSENFKDKAENTKTNLSAPITNENGKIEGTVEIGLNASMASAIAKTTKNSMFIVFTLVWAVFTIVILINTFLITRELSILHQGVKAISGGKFGTLLEHKEVSGEIKELFSAFNDMSSRLHIYEEQNIEELTLERNKFESVLMSIANGVVVCDSEDNVVLVNPIAENILSIKSSEIIDTSIANYVDIEGTACFKDEIEMFQKTPVEIIEKKPLEFNVDANHRVIKSVISPMFSKSHDYLGYIIVLIDITKEAEVDKLKSDFISNVSHELRTPVTVLRSYIDTLYSFGEEFKYEEQKEFIGVINQEIIRLNNMVNDILDFSKLESNTRYEKTPGDIMQTLETTLSNLKVLAEEKNVNFAVEKEGEIPLVPYNEESIERVISNLVTNAIKYAPQNSSINIKAKMSEKMAESVEITVTDSGMGISKEHQKKIFDRFYRVENDTHTIKGTGLGLHLVKVTIEKHHSGKVFVESELNKGSTFGFCLPLHPVEADLANELKHKTNV